MLRVYKMKNKIYRQIVQKKKYILKKMKIIKIYLNRTF
jgi:hypothetical protein